MKDLRPKAFSTVKYFISAGSPKSLPNLVGKEIMFIGRSNAGKSSLINAILNCNIARISKTPGRTQQINFFQIHSGDFLVDCPGYGFAAVGKAVQSKWPVLIKACHARPNLVGIIWIMDIRRPLQPADLAVVNSFIPAPCPVHIVLNKSDKANAQLKSKSLAEVRTVVSKLQKDISVQNFSVLKKTGLDQLYNVINTWLS